jgi:hypothetical protein
VQFFSPDEANALLATVRPLAEHLVAGRASVRADEARLAEIRGAVLGNGAHVDPREEGELRARIASSSETVARLVAEIHGLGAQVKDADVGLVDFPARGPGGDVVLLCWRVGEDEVAWWHGVDEGFAGRKPLPL